MSKPTKQFTGEIGIHYPLHVLNRYSLPELIGLAETAWQTMERFGFSQVWTNDNLEYRSVLASSAAIVARLPVKLGSPFPIFVTRSIWPWLLRRYPSSRTGARFLSA
jgi:hypothetical protein